MLIVSVAISVAGLLNGTELEVDLEPVSTYDTPATAVPSTGNQLGSFGIGGTDTPYEELIGVYADSTHWPYSGAPSLRFRDLAPENPNHPRDFEIGFYRYGPTLFTNHYIVEFWIGDERGEGGVFSVAGNGDNGAELQVRNPTDTDGISLNFTNPDYPVIKTETGRPLYLQANEGLVSENLHTFAAGIAIPGTSGYAGRITGGAWVNGQIFVASATVAADSLVILTPLSAPQGRWWVGDILPGEGFMVESNAADEDMDFNWLIVVNP